MMDTWSCVSRDGWFDRERCHSSFFLCDRAFFIAHLCPCRSMHRFSSLSLSFPFAYRHTSSSFLWSKFCFSASSPPSLVTSHKVFTAHGGYSGHRQRRLPLTALLKCSRLLYFFPIRQIAFQLVAQQRTFKISSRKNHHASQKEKGV